MLGTGLCLCAFALATLVVRWRRGAWPAGRLWWCALAVSGPAAVLALEAGWVATEVGRQPWIATELMLVREAVTPRTGVAWLLVGLVLLYLGLAWASVRVLRQMSARWRRGEDPPAPYGPREGSAAP
jgi:cytochrome d ubiquinol oxidase subunit I